MVLVVGGAGYIGSHTVQHLLKGGYNVVVYDNLSTGHRELVGNAVFEYGDLSDIERLSEVFGKNKIDTVIHFAASAYVGESSVNPSLYYRNNVCNGLNLLECMREHGVRDIIFSSSCTTYGIPEILPITEDLPLNPISPYGMTKYVFERILSDFAKAYDFNFVSFRYFNAAGADKDCKTGEWHIPETHAIPLILECAFDESKCFNVFGTDYPTRDGSCVRDYIHVDDLADAHVKAIDYLAKPEHVNYINLGTGYGCSVLELIEVAERVTGKKIKTISCNRRDGDPPELVASYDLAHRELNWKPVNSDVENIILTAWNWYKQLKGGL